MMIVRYLTMLHQGFFPVVAVRYLVYNYNGFGGVARPLFEQNI